MFITFEGIEGSGKSTQIENIGLFFRSKGLEFAVTREPGGTPIGERIRGILLDPQNREMDPASELLLYTADRAQHIQQVIMPSLQAGKIVLCDRFFDATVVYQGYARGIDTNRIQTLHQLMCGGLMPDLTFLFDLPAEEGLSRAWHQIQNGCRSGNETRFEKEAIEFHRKVRSGYLGQARKEPNRFQLIDAMRNEAQVREQIISVLSKRVNLALKRV